MVTLNPNIDPSAVKILVADDIPLNIMLIEKMLARFKFNIIKASNGADALQKVEEHHPTLLLLDLMMPQMDGYQALEELRKTVSREELPVIVLSALNSNDDISRAMSLGADDFITKPVVMERLHNCVLTYVNKVFE